jgi:ribosome biogenesis SPOUT family RNA methylase Rps3
LLEYLDTRYPPGGYVYRGQTKAYGGPLFPSAFRPILGSEDLRIDRTHPLAKHVLRGVGRSFYGEYNFKFDRMLSGLLDERTPEVATRVREVYAKALSARDALMKQDLALAKGEFIAWDDAVRGELSPEDLSI